MAVAGDKNAMLERIRNVKNQVIELKNEIKEKRKEKSNEDLVNACINSRRFPDQINPLHSRRILRGHFAKVYSADWSGDNVHFVSASQDGKLIVWNGVSTHKVQSIPLTSSWVITCAFEQSVNRLVASGGMDNVCTIYRVDRGGGSSTVHVVRVRIYHKESENICKIDKGRFMQNVSQELAGHLGYLSSSEFIGEHTMLTASGDGTCHCWDIERGTPTHTFREHKADVMSVSVSPLDVNVFASGSVDSTCKVRHLMM